MQPTSIVGRSWHFRIPACFGHYWHFRNTARVAMLARGAADFRVI
jgi:hypothetical protein